MRIKRILRTGVKAILPQSAHKKFRVISNFKRKRPGVGYFALLTRGKIIYADFSADYMDDYVRQMSRCFKVMTIDTDSQYIYPYDPWTWRVIPDCNNIICSITVDFAKVLETNFIQLKQCYDQCEDKVFANRQKHLIDSIEELAKRIADKLRIGGCNSERTQKLLSYFPQMLYEKPRSLDEAVQKILFFDALFWQANHWHIGLGRLDSILYDYYRYDIEKGILTREQAKSILSDLVNVLGKNTAEKSKTLLGDTGQYILLGGVNQDGNTVNNELTEMFLEIFEQYNHTDPKLILRVNNQTSSNVWKKAIDCVSNGNGSPLFMNEEPIMKNMIKFGYSKDDVYQLGTSACWEPLIIGKSFDQNNTLPCIITLRPLTKTLQDCHAPASFRDFMAIYKKNLSSYISTLVHDISYDCSPLFTLFFDDCLKSEKDFTDGGARYAFHGIQVLSFPNTINSLLNIRQYVFDRQVITIEKCIDVINSNFDGFEDYLELFRSGKKKYGCTDEDVIGLVNDLMTFIGDEVGKHVMNGKPIKVGFSSPNYIMSCKGVEASLDGRKADEPFAVHISPISSDIDIAEIMDFATKLNYDKNRINGNVVDFTIPPAYLKNKDKLCSLIIKSCEKGLFELQLNVLNYAQLKDAKEHPEKYPNLIVRVWGFSAYFNDLPEQYKDTLIERARLYEAS